MMFKHALPLLALTASAVAGPIEARGRSPSADPLCTVVSWYLSQHATPSAASSYCSSFLSIQTSTATVTTTSTASDTSMLTTTTTITSTPLAYDSVTATCTSISSAPSGAGVKRGASSTASATPTYACNACSNLLYPCGLQGSLSSPSVIAQPTGCPDSNVCRSLCWHNNACLSFSFDTSNNCKHYGKSIISQGLSKNQNSPVQIWDRDCFSCTSTSTAPTTTAKSSSTSKTPTSSNCATPSAPASSIIASACSCLNIKAQTTTAYVTAITTSYVATTVFTSTATSVAPTWTSTVTVAEIPFVSYGQYTAYNGDVYSDYAATDFYGYNYYSGYCGAPDGVINTPYANYTCQSFDDCQDICSKVNAARQPTDHQCLGISFSTGTPYCYLKYAVPGNGAPDCEVVEDMYNVNSSVLTSCAQAPASPKRARLF